jgi:hypothetical protein
MTATAAVVAAGLFDIALAAFHALFWRLFGWPQRLASLDPINRSVMPVLNLALTALFLILGVALIAGRAEATAGTMGRILLAGLTFFWLARAIIQAPYFGLRQPASIALTGVFAAGAILHAAPLLLIGAR